MSIYLKIAIACFIGALVLKFITKLIVNGLPTNERLALELDRPVMNGNFWALLLFGLGHVLAFIASGVFAIIWLFTL